MGGWQLSVNTGLGISFFLLEKKKKERGGVESHVEKKFSLFSFFSSFCATASVHQLIFRMHLKPASAPFVHPSPFASNNPSVWSTHSVSFRK